MEPVVFGLHTAEVKKWITQREVHAVKGFFGVKPDEPLPEQSQFYPDGITAIWIKEISGQKPRFYLHLKINFSRLLGVGNYIIMPYSTANIRKAITNVNKVLKLLPLSPENAEFTGWMMERADIAFDILEPQKRLMIWLLNQSLNLSNRRKQCERIEIRGKPFEESIYQSVRFGNSSFVYNVYDKEQEVSDKGKNLTETEHSEIHNLIRVERQNHPDAIKKLMPSRSVKDLADAKVRDNILRTMLDETKMFWGVGDYFSWRGIQENYSDHSEKISTIREAMIKVTANSLEAEYDTYKQVSDTFERLKIAPVGIPRGLGITSMQGLHNRLIAAYPRPADKRQYNSFPIPHKGADGRYRAVITLYWARGKKQLSIADRTLEGYEAKVFEKLKKVYLFNRIDNAKHPAAYAQSADSILRFWKTIKTKKVKQEVDNFLVTFSLKDGKNGQIKQEE